MLREQHVTCQQAMHKNLPRFCTSGSCRLKNECMCMCVKHGRFKLLPAKGPGKGGELQQGPQQSTNHTLQQCCAQSVTRQCRISRL